MFNIRFSDEEGCISLRLGEGFPEQWLVAEKRKKKERKKEKKAPTARPLICRRCS